MGIPREIRSDGMKMEPMSLKKFLEKSKTVRATLNIRDDFMVNGISTDTRGLQRGEVFVALRGEHFDGHDFLKTAVDRGAALLVTSQGNRISPEFASDSYLAGERYAGFFDGVCRLVPIPISGADFCFNRFHRQNHL